MAEITELVITPGMTVKPGAMQNWSDLADLPPVSDTLREYLAPQLDGVARCLIAGPHSLDFLRAVAKIVEQLVVVVRSLPDAAKISAALPQADVLCGSLQAAIAAEEPFDLVICLSGVDKLASAEDDQVQWSFLAQLLLNSAAEDGKIVMAVQSALGSQHCQLSQRRETKDDNANWDPLCTWDGTRPRTSVQLQQWAAQQQRACQISVLQGTWAEPAVIGRNLGSPSMRQLFGTLALRSSAEVLPMRDLLLADMATELATGWLVEFGVADSGQAFVFQSTAGQATTWLGTDSASITRLVVGQQPEQLDIPSTARSLLIELVECAINNDDKSMGRLLNTWNTAAQAAAAKQLLAPNKADLRFSNLLIHEDSIIWLATGARSTSLAAAQHTALADFLKVLFSQGLPHSWSSSMNHETIFYILCERAGIAPPTDLQRLIADIESPPNETLSINSLLAVIERQKEELRGAWSRFHWDEQKYFTYYVARETREAAQRVTAGMVNMSKASSYSFRKRGPWSMLKRVVKRIMKILKLR